MVDKKGDDGGGQKYGQQDAGDEVHPPMPVKPVHLGKQPAGDVARQKKILLLHRGLQQVANAGNANRRDDDVEIKQHG